MLYRVHLTMKGIRTTLVVIGTDCIGPLAINEMRTSSVSEGAKIKHINLRKIQN